MTNIKTAEQAYNASVEAAGAAEREIVAQLIDKACSNNKFNTFAKVSEDTANYLRKLGYSVDEQTNFGKVTGYEISWSSLPPAFVEVTSSDDIKTLIAGDEPEVYVTLTEDINIPTASDEFVVPAGKKVTLNISSTVTAGNEAFKVENGGTLVLTGEGTINCTNNDANGVIRVDGADALVVIDGVTIDANSNGSGSGCGVYLMNDSSVTLKSGSIKCAYGACISTNNTTGGATNINIRGGELLAKAHALYLPSHCNVVISGGKVQGINARMGNITVKGDAEIIPVALNADTADDIGEYFDYSGFVWIGDTVTVMAGTYNDPKGNDFVLNVAGNATIKANYRSAIGIYAIDTKEYQNVTVNVSKLDNVTTTDANADAITIYNHEYINERAIAKGKNYNPTKNSNIKVSGINK